MPWHGVLTAVLLATSLVLSACGSILSSNSDGRVTLEFFQFKPEAVQTFDKIIAAFEAEHPHIQVVQHHVPNAEAAVRARLVKNAVPDVLTLNGNATFGELASAGVFHDFAGDPVTENVNPAVQQILDDLGTHRPGEINGLPLAANANGVLYNKDLFAQHGVTPPTTWNELIAVAEKFQAAGITPFYGTLKDSWTALPAFNALAANLPPRDFFAQRAAGNTTFQEAYPEVADKLAELYRYAQPDMLSRDYNAGNQAFAQGRAAMYLQGSYALPAIEEFGPEFEIGTFALPPTEDPSRTLLVSGVDVALTMSRSTEHPEEAMTFIRYLMRPDVVTTYAREQNAIPPLKGLRSDDPALAELLPYFDQGRITGYPDHRIPPAVPLKALLQQYLIDGRRDALLRALDGEWDKVQARRS